MCDRTKAKMWSQCLSFFHVCKKTNLNLYTSTYFYIYRHLHLREKKNKRSIDSNIKINHIRKFKKHLEKHFNAPLLFFNLPFWAIFKTTVPTKQSRG